jgi:hypothetical protein
MSTVNFVTGRTPLEQHPTGGGKEGIDGGFGVEPGGEG